MCVISQAWTNLYELRGLPSTSALFDAWGAFGCTLLQHGAFVRFRRVLMRPVLFHLEHTLRACAGNTADMDGLGTVRVFITWLSCWW